jgi:hypothetical protein
MKNRTHSGNYNLSFGYDPNVFRTGEAIDIVKRYTANYQFENDWDEVIFYVNGLPHDKAKELEAEIESKNPYYVEVEKARFGEGGELKVGDWVKERKGTARGQVYKIDDLGIYLQDKYGNQSNMRYFEKQLKLGSKPRYSDGGGIGDSEVATYFKNLDYSKLPPAFSDYVKREILTDEDLEYLAPNEPVFIELKNRIEERIGKVEPKKPFEDKKPVISEDALAVMKEIQDLRGLIDLSDGEELEKINKEIEDLTGLLDTL